MCADDTTVYCIGDTVDNTVTFVNKVLSEMSSWILESELFDASIIKVRSYALDEKTAHQAATFCDYRRGSDRVGETLSSFWLTIHGKSPVHLQE